MSKYFFIYVPTFSIDFFIQIQIFLFRWQPDSKFPYSQVRLPQEPDSKVEFMENMEVEVYSRSNGQEAFGWWKARIKVTHIFTIYFKSCLNFLYIFYENKIILSFFFNL